MATLEVGIVPMFLRQRLTGSISSSLPKVVSEHTCTRNGKTMTMIYAGNNDTVNPITIYKHSGR